MSEQIIGKLSDDASLSCSQLPGLAGESRYQTPNSIVKNITDVIAARKAGRADPARYPLMEYFLDGKPLRDCSAECQRQMAELKTREAE